MKFRFFLVYLLVALVLPAYAQETAQDATTVTHTIQRGETLYSIALRYGVTVSDLSTANNITNPNYIYFGQTLTIPGLTVPDSSAEVENPLLAVAPIEHIIQPGETLQTIADKYGITVDDIIKANGIANPNFVQRGQKLMVWSQAAADAEQDTLEASTPAIETAPVIHTVRSGEILSRIAEKYGVSMTSIMQANAIVNANHVLVGQRLTIPGATVPAETTTTNVGSSANLPLVTPPSPKITEGKYIHVDLSDSTTYAFQDGVLVYSALSSMGLPATPTVVGEFKIYNRLDSQTMSGPGYWLPNVEYVQYFYQGYALHGAYWHDNFGQPMSHGCVNLRNVDAQWLYSFSELGTTVIVEY